MNQRPVSGFCVLVSWSFTPLPFFSLIKILTHLSQGGSWSPDKLCSQPWGLYQFSRGKLHGLFTWCWPCAPPSPEAGNGLPLSTRANTKTGAEAGPKSISLRSHKIWPYKWTAVSSRSIFFKNTCRRENHLEISIKVERVLMPGHK